MPENKLFRCEIWAIDEGGLIVEYIWSESSKHVEAMFEDHFEGHLLYRLRECSEMEREVWNAGYEEGYDIAIAVERMTKDDGRSYVNVDLNSPDESFICGLCSRTVDNFDKSDKTIYLGLYGSEWQVCNECESRAD